MQNKRLDSELPIITSAPDPFLPSLPPTTTSETTILPDSLYPQIDDLNCPTIDDLNCPTIDDLNCPTIDDLNCPTIDDLNCPTIDDLNCPTIDDLNCPTLPQVSYKSVSDEISVCSDLDNRFPPPSVPTLPQDSRDFPFP